MTATRQTEVDSVVTINRPGFGNAKYRVIGVWVRLEKRNLIVAKLEGESTSAPVKWEGHESWCSEV